ncbi:MAG: MotA/TolQ/ExbB proton channel family protein [Chlamydiales bacterium]
MQIASLPFFMDAYIQSDFVGKLIFLALFSLSGITWFYIIYKLYLMYRITFFSDQFRKSLESTKQPILNPTTDSDDLKNPFSTIYSSTKKKTIEILDKNHFFLSKQARMTAPITDVYLSHIDIEFIEGFVYMLLESEREKLEKDSFILSTISTLAPFLGLLGTVWGILMTFTGIAQGGNFMSNAVILSGLSTALVTTVLGLFIAIPALIFHNIIRHRVRSYCNSMQNFGSNLLSTIEIQYRKVDFDV